jgi:uncharacterized protein
MSVYLDASAVVSLFLIDAFSVRARALLGDVSGPIVADWCVVEVSSVISTQVRIGAITQQDAQKIFTNFDAWRANLEDIETSAVDMAAAAQFVRRPDLALRGPDALHIAIASRLGAKLLTFDAKMAAAATALGVETIT